MLLFYLQAIDNNIELSLDLILSNASIHSPGIIPLLSLAVSKRKQELFYSIKCKTVLEIWFIPKMFEVTFLSSI